MGSDMSAAQERKLEFFGKRIVRRERRSRIKFRDQRFVVNSELSSDQITIRHKWNNLKIINFTFSFNMCFSVSHP